MSKKIDKFAADVSEPGATKKYWDWMFEQRHYAKQDMVRKKSRSICSRFWI